MREPYSHRNYLGPLTDPEVRRARGRMGAAATNSLDGRIRSIARQASDLDDDQRDTLVKIAAPTEDDLIDVLVRRAPALDHGQISQLRQILAEGAR